MVSRGWTNDRRREPDKRLAKDPAHTDFSE